MTVILVILTFGFFLTLDYAIRYRAAKLPLAVAAEGPAIPLAAEPVWVAGYQTPEACHYHPGHTWARVLSDGTALVGMDDFARQLIGPAEKVTLPAIGAWLHAGAPAAHVALDGRTAALVSPVEGEVVAVNPALARQPELATADPFGQGWLYRVRSADLKSGFASLLSGSLARRFMEDARERLDHQLMTISGTVLADGGEPIADFARHLPEAQWRQLVHELLLT